MENATHTDKFQKEIKIVSMVRRENLASVATYELKSKSIFGSRSAGMGVCAFVLYNAHHSVHIHVSVCMCLHECTIIHVQTWLFKQQPESQSRPVYKAEDPYAWRCVSHGYLRGLLGEYA